MLFTPLKWEGKRHLGSPLPENWYGGQTPLLLEGVLKLVGLLSRDKGRAYKQCSLVLTADSAHTGSLFVARSS
jgi:hypothetical protein